MIKQPSDQYSHLSDLDGFRACLALWVYFGHLAYAVGYQNKLLALHPVAVDLFMVLSGFLMVHTWKGHHGHDNFFSALTLKFYLARVFRIAPLYFFLLVVCFWCAGSLSRMHDLILVTFPPPWVPDPANYHPVTAWPVTSPSWWGSHLSFMFGLIPGMEASTPLPDWSLSLEMQFYLIFPLLLLLRKKISLALLVGTSIVLAFYAPYFLGNYLDAGVWAHFGQPSALPYRLSAFVAGMLTAYWLQHHRQTKKTITKSSIYYVVLGLLCIAPLSKPVVLLYGGFFILITGAQPSINRLFKIRFLRFLGEISYSIYLAHVLIVTALVFWLIQLEFFANLVPEIRFFIALVVTAPAVLSVSYLLYRYVEKPGVRVGSTLTSRIG
jgi:peptidoglycan/LPS O-acetylase OafA/YrhL